MKSNGINIHALSGLKSYRIQVKPVCMTESGPATYSAEAVMQWAINSCRVDVGSPPLCHA